VRRISALGEFMVRWLAFFEERRQRDVRWEMSRRAVTASYFNRVDPITWGPQVRDHELATHRAHYAWGGVSPPMLALTAVAGGDA
jgi:hypothetical protein